MIVRNMSVLYVARHHISNEEWQRRLNNFKDVPEHTHA